MTGAADVTGERELRALVRAAPGLTVLTGGQTGVDTYAALAALRAGLPVHLVYPHGYRQEDGALSPARRRRLSGAVLHELGPSSFRYRTWTCVYLADVVVLLDPAGGSGCQETVRAARKLGRPLLAPEPGGLSAAQVTEWLASYRCPRADGGRVPRQRAREQGQGPRDPDRSSGDHVRRPPAARAAARPGRPERRELTSRPWLSRRLA